MDRFCKINLSKVDIMQYVVQDSSYQKYCNLHNRMFEELCRNVFNLFLSRSVPSIYWWFSGPCRKVFLTSDKIDFQWIILGIHIVFSYYKEAKYDWKTQCDIWYQLTIALENQWHSRKVPDIFFFFYIFSSIWDKKCHAEQTNNLPGPSR